MTANRHAMPQVDLAETPCQACGITPAQDWLIGREFGSLVFDKDAGMTFLCKLCEGLVEAGMLRREQHDEGVRYRQWHFEWTPGDLLPVRTVSTIQS